MTTAMNSRISQFLADRRPATPCLVMDLSVIEENYRELRRVLPLARVYYAVKANPAPAIIERLAGLGACFDTASRGEIELCLNAGVPGDRISFGNTIKKASDIAFAHQNGVRLFAMDSDGELQKIAAAAPGASVYCRVLTDGNGAEWPLSRKFGCSSRMAAVLLLKARDLGLDPCGISFHIGSQQSDLRQWDVCVGARRQAVQAPARGRAGSPPAQSRRRLPDPLPPRRAGCRALRQRRHGRGDQAFRQCAARHDRRARPCPGGQCR